MLFILLLFSVFPFFLFVLIVRKGHSLSDNYSKKNTNIVVIIAADLATYNQATAALGGLQKKLTCSITSKED
jgi:hypothetical protein